MAAPYSDYLYAMDRAWWKVNIRQVVETFKGQLATIISGCFNAKCYSLPYRNNSGAGAIELAIQLGAENIILLGYDMQHTGGKKHWHADHPKPLFNAGKIKDWPAEFEKIKRQYPAVNILNCSRNTALTVFKRIALEDALNEFN